MPANNSRDNSIDHHRACRGKAHASGIGKKNGRAPSSNSRSFMSSTGSSVSGGKQPKMSRKDGATSTPQSRSDPHVGRKLSRHSTSSWEYSDSDSINSSETGHVNDSLKDSANSMIRSIDLVLRDIDSRDKVDSDSPKSSSVMLKSSRSFRSSGTPKRESWAESLRGGYRIVDDRYRKMEQGWDDSSVIKNPKERKWHRITAVIEQRSAHLDDDFNNLSKVNEDKGLKRNDCSSEWKGQSSGRVIKRSRYGQHARRPVYDVVEWEELLEMAMNRKFNRLGKKKQDARPGTEFLKNLDILLANRVPQNFQVLLHQEFRGHSFKAVVLCDGQFFSFFLESFLTNYENLVSWNFCYIFINI